MLAFFNKIGPFVLWYAVILLGLTLLCVLTLYVQYRRTRGLLEDFRSFLERSAGSPADLLLTGLPLATLDEIRAAAAKTTKQTMEWWNRISGALIPYAGSRATAGWFLARPASAVLSQEILVEPTFNQRFARALPGLVTSAGLLGTFVAILIGLLDLRVLPDQRIDGIGTLIENLAGKFLTSIVAISFSIAISVVELQWLRRLKDAQRRMLEAVERLLPRLDEIVILRDMQEDARKQAVSLSNISSEVVDRFEAVFTTELLPAFAQNMRVELAPALEGVSESMNRVRDLLGSIQQEKQESVVGEFRALAEGLENTLKNTLEQIGRDFRASLSGSTTGEFDKASSALGASAEVLRGLNDSFNTMRDSLEAVVTEARRATAEQMANGSERAKSLNDLVEQLLVRLNESATNNAGRVQELLTQTVEGLHRQMADLSSQMTTAVTNATSNAAAASQEVMQAAGAASRMAQQDADQLSKKLEATLERMEGIGDSLGAAQATVRQAISESAVALRAFEHAGAEIRASATALAGTATTAKELQEGMRSTMGRVTESVTQLSVVAHKQHEILERQMTTFAEVERVFDGLDAHLGDVLGEITTRLQQHNQALQQNFEAILSRVNTEVPKVSNALQAATEELSSQVEDLTDVLERLRVSVKPA